MCSENNIVRCLVPIVHGAYYENLRREIELGSSFYFLADDV